MSLYKDSDGWDDFKHKLQQLKETVEPRHLLESLGFVISRETSKELRGACKIHGGDNKTSFRFNKEALSWVCFSHRCQEVNGSDIIGLIRTALGMSFKDAVDYLHRLCGESGDFLSRVQYERKKEKHDFIKRYKDDSAPPAIVKDEYLESFKRYRSNLFPNEGFPRDVLDYFEVAGGYTDSFSLIRDIIPIRDVNSDLVAYSLRDIRPNAPDDDFKYILTRGFVKDKVLYNLHRVKEEVQTNRLIVVEGFKSVWRLYQYGITNVVAVMGSMITPGQINLLCTYALRGAVVMFDNDVAGVKGTISAVNELSGKLSVFPIFITETDENGKGLDPADLDKQTIFSYLGKGE